MKLPQYSEFWYAVIIGIADCIAAVPVLFFSYHAFTDGGHGAILGWGTALLALVLLSWAFWCCIWEIMMLHLHQIDATVSETAPAVIFCSGLLALLLALAISVVV